MKKRVLALILLLGILMASGLPLTPPAQAADLAVATAQADALNELGLFKGTNNGYELERAPTRIEALVMLIRLLGREAAATGSEWAHPFTDVPNWARNYVGYAYQTGLTKGTSATTFGAGDTASARMYLTFVLRALGYSDGEGGDFAYSDPYTLARSIGILSDAVDTVNFTRGDAVLISWAALGAKLKSSSSTLSARLISAAVFSSAAYTAAKETAANPVDPNAQPESGSAEETRQLVGNSAAQLDIGHLADGYVSVAYTGTSNKRIRVIVTTPGGTKNTYDLNNSGDFESFPLTGGNGRYSVGVYVNTAGTRYSVAYSTTVDVTLSSPNAPWLAPNQYVNYTAGDTATRLAAELTAGCSGDLARIDAIYNYVVDTLTYNRELAQQISSGAVTVYVPDLEQVLATKKGICFDYASLMTAMLRCQGIPTKLVVGYAGSVYHAWISTYTAETGWVDGAIYFDGKTWKRMDPTFASSSGDDSILDYIGDGSNYTAKYYY